MAAPLKIYQATHVESAATCTVTPAMGDTETKVLSMKTIFEPKTYELICKTTVETIQYSYETLL